MKRALLAVAGAALAVSTVLPGSALGQGATGDSVMGSGTVRFFTPPFEGLTTDFEINVQSGPSGELPSGHVTLLLEFSGPPSCVSVQGHSAAMNFQNPLFGNDVLIQVSDRSGEGLPDLIGTGATLGCPLGVLPQVQAEVVTGDLVVFDAQPFPTSKNQCKNGGWRQFGFRNQGQCEAFALRGPRP